MASTDYSESHAVALDALANGDKDTAFRTWRLAVRWPADGMDGSEKQFVDAFHLFSQIAEQFADESFVALIRSVAEAPNDPQALYDLGYALYEESLFGIASTVLQRAYRIVPSEPTIVSELVSSLESDGNNMAALQLLEGEPELVQSDFLFAYLKAYNALMTGNVDL